MRAGVAGGKSEGWGSGFAVEAIGQLFPLQGYRYDVWRVCLLLLIVYILRAFGTREV